MKKIITFISDTHTKHEMVGKDLPGGDILIHAGDFMNSGYFWNEAYPFLEWYDGLNQYDNKVLIAGNHDRLFEDKMKEIPKMMEDYPNIKYLLDQKTFVDGIKIYGSPWQPEFYDWAFNLPRNGEGLSEKWFWIPDDTDILVTHGPPWGHLDVTPYGNMNVGCELLRLRVDEVKPKIHVFGHIHSGYGYKFHEGTHFFNVAVLGERYTYDNKPMTVEWDSETNEIEFL
jgi:predicted phosphodiesterase